MVESHDERIAWWNPWNWPTGIWVLVIGSILMSLPFMIRIAILSGVPVMPEPFDTAEFVKWDVPDEENAFTDYILAAEVKKNIGTNSVPASFDSVMMSDSWSKSDEALITWMQNHREALDIWRRGTTRQKGRYISPRDLSVTTLLPIVQEQRTFARLASMEVYRCLDQGELEEAYQWSRAICRSGGHTTYRGCLIQSLVGNVLHAMASNSLQLWAEHPLVTSQQLLAAQAAVHSDEALYEPTSNCLKSEYMAVENTLTSGEWRDAMIMSGGRNTGFISGVMKGVAWVMGEPELMRRLYRQTIANQLREIDKPMATRTRLVGSTGVMLFDLDPAVPLLPGQMDPLAIDQKINRSVLMKLIAPAMKSVDEVAMRRRARKSALEVLLAVQAYQRDHGQYPAELSAIVPKYLKQIPPDDFDKAGGAMRYRTDDEGGAVVWSIGPDAIDGNGDVVAKNAKSADVGFVIKLRSN